VESHPCLPVVTIGENPIVEMMELNKVSDDDHLAFALGDELHKHVAATTDPHVLHDSDTLPFHSMNHCKCYCQFLTVTFQEIFLLLTSKIMEHKFRLRDITVSIDPSNQPVQLPNYGVRAWVRQVTNNEYMGLFFSSST
jgi:hypothetical protein